MAPGKQEGELLKLVSSLWILSHPQHLADASSSDEKTGGDDPHSHRARIYPPPPGSPPPRAQQRPGSGGRSGPAHPRWRLADVTSSSRRPPPSFSVAVALTERDGGGRVCRSTGDRVGKARVLPASEEPDQSKLYGAEAGRGSL